ncbi:MAG TPA: glycosyltransferase family 39 protein [Candidatus Limnocylindrales bacterium]|nr:glycosyltransferase family 39 protein [Candidatus Limnocylindrales bacterium]
MTSRRDLAPAAGVFLVALAYLLVLRPYGFQLEDEGTHLFWFDRVMRGQQPYVDFHTGYTPGFFAFGKAVFSLFGESATALRAVLAVVNALTAAGMAELTRRITGSWIAWVPPLLWLAFVPVFTGEFAAFNVPYPTWAVTFAWALLAFAMLAWIESRQAALLVGAGAAAALAMWFRPNSGAFALAAATWLVVAASSRRSLLDRIAAPLAAVFMAAGVWYTFEFRVAGMDALVHLVPMFAIAALLAGPVARRLPRRDTAGTAASLACLGAAFAIPTLAWALPLWLSLGRDRFLYEVFLVGADYQTLYYKPHPPAEPYALLIVATLIAVAVGGRFVAARRVRPLPILLTVAAVGAITKLVVFREGLAPEGLVHSIVAQLENASFWLAAVTSFGAAGWLWRVGADELGRSPRTRALLVLTPIATAMYMQMFPRSDFMHQITSVPLTMVVACGLLDRTAAWWSRGHWPNRWNAEFIVRLKVLTAAAATVAIGFVDNLGGPIQSMMRAAPVTPMPARLDVRVEAAAGDEVESIASTVAFLRARTDEGEALWSFPATSGLLFAAGRANVAPHDYWYPGRPDRAEEARVLGLLAIARPRFIVTLNKGWNFLDESPAYFSQLRAFVVREYGLAARYGRYDILGRRDVIGGDASLPDISPMPAGTASGRDSVIQPNLERRRQAAWRWMESMTPEEAQAAALPEDRHGALLLLRALRDGGDMRGAAWAILGYESKDPRIRREAVDAMLALSRANRAARTRFADDFNAAVYRPFVAQLAAAANELSRIELLRPFASDVAELAAAGDSAN